jgi:hypothetical protein
MLAHTTCRALPQLLLLLLLLLQPGARYSSDT